MLSTGPGLAAILFGWASLRYFRLGRRTRHIGAYVICGGMVLTCATSVAAAGVVFDAQYGAEHVQPPARLQHRRSACSSRSGCSCWCSRT